MCKYNNHWQTPRRELNLEVGISVPYTSLILCLCIMHFINLIKLIIQVLYITVVHM